MDLVLKLRELRHLRRLSQKDAGRLSRIGEKTLSSFETGERIDSMKLSHLQALLKVYDVSEEDFFSDKLDKMFDPTYVRVTERLDEVLARVAALPEHVRAGIVEAMICMVDATTLALPAPRSVQSRPPGATALAAFRHAPAA